MLLELHGKGHMFRFKKKSHDKGASWISDATVGRKNWEVLYQ